MPCHLDKLLPKLLLSPAYFDEVYREKKTDRGNTAHLNNHRHKIVEGEQLSPGERVWIPDLRTEGLVVKNLGNPRSVTIGTPKSATRGNRLLLWKLEPRLFSRQTSKSNEPLNRCSRMVKRYLQL